MFDSGPRLTPEHYREWWEEISKLFAPPPAGQPMGDARRWKWTGDVPFHYNSATAHYFAEDTDLKLMRRFHDQATRIAEPARQILGEQGLLYAYPNYASAYSWSLTCYFAVWDRIRFPSIDYTLNYWGCPDVQVDVDAASFRPVTSFEAYVEWEERRRVIPREIYFIWLSTDIRAATVQVIDAILSLDSGANENREDAEAPIPAAGRSLGITIDFGKAIARRQGFDAVASFDGETLALRLIDEFAAAEHNTLVFEDIDNIYSKYGGTYRPERNTMLVRISGLRTIIAPLGLSITSVRSNGYKMVPATSP